MLTQNHAAPDVALVVLGAAVWANEQPSPSFRRRADHAATLYHQGRAGHIVCSGGLGRFPPTEAEMFRRLLSDAGVPPQALILEDASHTTFDNVLFSARKLRRIGVGRVIVVSDKYHLPRAVMCFWALGFRTRGSGPDRANTGTPFAKWIKSYLRELAALPFYLLKLPRLRRAYARPD